MKEDQSHLPGKTSGEWWLYKGHLYNDLSLGSIKEIYKYNLVWIMKRKLKQLWSTITLVSESYVILYCEKKCNM